MSSQTPGLCISDKQAARPFSATQTGQKLPQSLADGGSRLVLTNSALYLENGDFCELNHFVIVKRPGQATFIARVAEILQIKGSAEDYSKRPSGILLESVKIGTTADPSYGMPSITAEDQWSLVPIAV